MHKAQPHEWTPTRWLLWFLLGVSVGPSLQALPVRAIGGGFATRGNLASRGILDSACILRETLLAGQALIGVTIAGLLIVTLAPLRVGKLFRRLAWP